jgi:glycosyltransferase involved in cell wall biosynthesis
MSAVKVTHYQRKSRPAGNFSLEAIFADVRKRLHSQIEIAPRIAPCLSNGLFRRLWIMLDAAFHQSDVTHVTGDITFAAILLRKRRCVLTILDCIGADSRQGWAGSLYRAIWFRWPVARTQVVTTISEASKQDIVRITHCDPEKVKVIGVAISPRFKRVDREFNTDCPRILQVGAAPNKNIERLIAALEPLRCKLVIVGQLNDSQRSALKQHKIDVELHERLSEDELHEQYVNSDIIAFASVFEGFGMPILEGNVVGRAVVTGNCTSMPEVAGDAACIVNPFEVASIRAGFLKVIHDAEYRSGLIENGFKNARRFDPNVIAHQYLEVYLEVAAAISVQAIA